MSKLLVVGTVVHYAYVDDDDRPRCRPAVVSEIGQYVTVTTRTTVPGSFDRSEGRPIREVQAEQWWYFDACALVVLPTNSLVEGCRHDERERVPGTWHLPHLPERVELPR